MAVVVAVDAATNVGVGVVCWAGGDLFDRDTLTDAVAVATIGVALLHGGSAAFAKKRGERGWAGGAGGTGNPYAHMRRHPTKADKVLFRDPQTGRDVVKAKPAGFDEYEANKPGRDR